MELVHDITILMLGSCTSPMQFFTESVFCTRYLKLVEPPLLDDGGYDNTILPQVVNL